MLLRLWPLYSFFFNYYREDFEYFLHFKTCWRIKYFTFIALISSISVFYLYCFNFKYFSIYPHKKTSPLKGVNKNVNIFSMQNSWHTHSALKAAFSDHFITSMKIFFSFLFWNLLEGFYWVFYVSENPCINLWTKCSLLSKIVGFYAAKWSLLLLAWGHWGMSLCGPGMSMVT